MSRNYYMSTVGQTKNKKHHPIIICLVCFICLGAISFFVCRIFFARPNTVRTVSETSNENQHTENTPSATQASTNIVDEGNHTPVQNDGDNPNISEVLTGFITHWSHSDSSAHVRVNIDQYLTAGTCELTLTAPSGEAYTTTAPVTSAASTSTCQGFDIPTTYENGDWTISIRISSDDKTGTISEVKSL